MNNKNIIFNHTLEQYNKKYRNRGYRLLKFTKKEVEDFDKLHHTEKGCLLKGRKWWLIKDAYYEIPKAPRHTWFRNLNAAVQAGICLLGAGIVATAVTIPLVLLNQNQTVEPSITIQGADFDKSASHIELHKESTIKLKEQSGKTITDIVYVKVADKTLDTTEYSFNPETKIVTIKAEAMTSTKIEIKVETKNPHIVDLETWIEKANKLNADFLNSTLEYTLEQITKYVQEGKEKTLKSVKYINDPEEGREFWVYFEDKTGTAVVGSQYSGDSLFKNGCITDKGVCEIYDDEIVYKNENAGKKEYKELHINKFGYPTYELLGDGTLYEIKFNSEPTEPEPEVEEIELIYDEEDESYENRNITFKANTNYKFKANVESGKDVCAMSFVKLGESMVKISSFIDTNSIVTKQNGVTFLNPLTVNDVYYFFEKPTRKPFPTFNGLITAEFKTLDTVPEGVCIVGFYTDI